MDHAFPMHAASAWAAPYTAGYAALAERFRPIFRRIEAVPSSANSAVSCLMSRSAGSRRPVLAPSDPGE